VNHGKMTDWPTVPLGVLLTDIQPGFASGKHNSTGEGIPHFRPMNVSIDGRIERTALKYVEPTAGRPELRLRRGDVVFNNTNSPELVGKTAVFEDEDAPAFSNHMTRLRSNPERLDPAYLALRLHQAWREGWFSAHCNNHVSQSSISRDVLRAFEIELPPIEIQRTIIGLHRQVDALRASGNDHLIVARRTIERLRQSILAAACFGQLTVDWRRSNGHGDDPTSEPIMPRNMPKIPASWTYRRVEEIAAPGTAVSYGIVLPGPEVSNGVPYVRQQDVAQGTVLINQLRHTAPEIAAKHKRSSLREGDVLLCIIRNLRVAVSPRGINGANITQGMVRIRPGKRILGEYLAAYLESPYTQRWMKDQYIGLAMPRINVAHARAIPISLPPVDEQIEIVFRLRSLLGFTNDMQRRIDAAVRRLDLGSRSVFAKALSGELSTSGVALDR